MAALALGLGAERVFALRFAGAARAAVGLAVLVGCVNLAAVIPPYRDFERLVFSADPGASRAIGEGAFARTMMQVHREPLLTPYVELAFAYGATVDATQLKEKLALVTRAAHFAPVDVVVYRLRPAVGAGGRTRGGARPVRQVAAGLSRRGRGGRCRTHGTGTPPSRRVHPSARIDGCKVSVMAVAAALPRQRCMKEGSGWNSSWFFFKKARSTCCFSGWRCPRARCCCGR